MAFTQPPSKSKIPEPVPLESLDEDQQNLYKGLKASGGIATSPELDKPLPELSPEEVSEFQQLVLLETDPSDPTDNDKKTFVRSILSEKQYEKQYTLFGSVLTIFVDRSVNLTEQLYKELYEDIKGATPKITATSDEDYEIWLERYKLAACLTRIDRPNQASVHYSAKNGFYPLAVQLMTLPKPIYTALMETSRIFERHVEILIRRAQDSNFWKTGGAN
jgi:hypothetical protein